MPFRTFILILFFLPLTACLRPGEVPVQIIPLASPLNLPMAELSGLTWCQNKLVLMPQYPRRLNEEQRPDFYFLDKDDIRQRIEEGRERELEPARIRVNENGIRDLATEFDGYEAIACNGSNVWLSIEAVSPEGRYFSYLVQGSIDLHVAEPAITLDPSRLWNLPSQSDMRNMGDEAILYFEGNVLSLHELNDSRAVAEAKAISLDPVSGEQSNFAFPHLPYRITDATAIDSQNRFWVINYKYSGDDFSRNADDPLSERYGKGRSHRKFYNVERLLEYRIEKDEIKRVDRPPIQLEMIDVEGRNWEGIARLDDIGFLLVTDKHPGTLLGFVPFRQSP